MQRIDKEIEISKMVGGDLMQRYEIYVGCVDNGKGVCSITKTPIKTFEEWLNS